ncbi:MAG: hypothetical protein A2Y77_06965 [Planctomycetes bacterium RBG_13_62_9]|nr:MAG: hypothetical protein A2Y77_06965 [Planctomycetes bacterium RBG_13_62_9]
MEREELKRIIDSPESYNETKAETVYAWFRDCYSRRMRWVMICVYVQYGILLVPIVYSAIAFFRTDQVRLQILHATVFLFGNLWMGFISVFAWVMMQRPSISREIKRLELSIAELSETIRKA